MKREDGVTKDGAGVKDDAGGKVHSKSTDDGSFLKAVGVETVER